MSNTASDLFMAQRRSWWQHREVSLNWLALGLLLAAWNGADNDVSPGQTRRPEVLRRHACISVRAVQRTAEIRCARSD